MWSLREQARGQSNALSDRGATTALERFYQPNQCGPVALYAVCRIQGVPAKIAELAKLAGTDRHGTTAGGIVRAARAKGLETQAWKSTVRHLRRLNGPVIIDFPRGHFVVLAGWKDDRALILDPPAASGTAFSDVSVPSTAPPLRDGGCRILCRSPYSQAIFAEAHPWLWECAACHLVGVHPVPDADVLASIYNDQYFRTFGYGPGGEACYRAIRRRSARRLLALAERYFAAGNLLDVGSGLGDMLAEANRRGWNPTGVEPNPWARQEADRAAPGATRTCATEAFEPDDSRFDLITCVDVIEHLRRPDGALRSFFRWLRPGGGLLLTTPDIGSFSARVMGSHWPHYHIDHLWYFNRRTLTALVKEAGFEIVAWRRAPKVFNLAYIAGIFEHNARSRWIRGAASACLRFLPAWLLRQPLPAIREGQLLIARRPLC